MSGKDIAETPKKVEKKSLTSRFMNYVVGSSSTNNATPVTNVTNYNSPTPYPSTASLIYYSKDGVVEPKPVLRSNSLEDCSYPTAASDDNNGINNADETDTIGQENPVYVGPVGSSTATRRGSALVSMSAIYENDEISSLVDPNYCDYQTIVSSLSGSNPNSPNGHHLQSNSTNNGEGSEKKNVMSMFNKRDA